MAVTVPEMLKMSQTQLDDLFTQSPVGEIPSGEGKGTAIIAPGTNVSDEIARFVNVFTWKGKVFDPEKGELRNKILPMGHKAIVAKVYKDKSWFDQKECIVLDYSKTSLIAHWIRDEIREVSPGIYLGLVYWGKKKLIHFALQFPARDSSKYQSQILGFMSAVNSNVSRPMPRANTGSRFLNLVSDTTMFLLQMERRIDPWLRPIFDATLRDPVARIVTALMNKKRKDEGLKIAEEKLLPNEEEFLNSVIESFTTQMRGLWKPGGFERGGNTKTQGIVRGEFIVHDNLPPQFRYGIYARPQTFRCWVRFSGPGPYITPDIDDVGFMSISIKLMGVPGPKLMDEEKFTVDMFGVSTPTFVTQDIKSNAHLQKWSVKNAQIFHFVNFEEPHIADMIMQGLWVKTQSSPFEAPYFSCVPYLLGEGQAMQYSVWPKTNKKTPIPRLPLRPPDDYLRNAMVKALNEGDVELDFRLQLQTDPFLMPIENNGVLWPEKLSPRVSVATLRLPKQKFDSPAQMEFARKLSYNPWHTIAEHRPLGNQSRARRRMYFELSQLRHNMNNVPHYEPTGDEVFE